MTSPWTDLWNGHDGKEDRIGASVADARSQARDRRANLTRFPARWSHLAGKETRQINKLEKILVGEVSQLRRDLLQGNAFAVKPLTIS